MGGLPGFRDLRELPQSGIKPEMCVSIVDGFFTYGAIFLDIYKYQKNLQVKKQLGKILHEVTESATVAKNIWNAGLLIIYK